MAFILQGLLLGFSIAAPVGPIGILCIRKSLAQGSLYGFVSGAGAATADALYASIAALGLTALTQFLIEQAMWIHGLGALFLLYIAFQTLRAPIRTMQPAGNGKPQGFFGTYGTTLLLTLTNPMTILSFIGLFAGFTLSGKLRDSILLVFGVFMGSLLWWLALSTAAGAFRRQLDQRWMRGINIGSGSLLLLFGLYQLVRMVGD